MYVENRTKIANFLNPLYLTPPMKGLPLEFGIGVRGPKCLNDGPTRWSKKFSDRFSRFDTIPAVTDSHPASHVAVAITLYAKASTLKSWKTPLELKVNKSMECDIFPFSALTLLVSHQEGYPACKKLKVGCWFVGGDDVTRALHDL